MALSWAVATVVGLRSETATARTIVLRIPTWRGHIAGQHLDIRLTAEDGYTAVRSYSIASSYEARTPGEHDVELTIERTDDGEVSPYLVMQLGMGDRVEVRGPIGGWFVWRPEQREPIQLIAGGSGIVPLMAMVRASRALVAQGTIAAMRLLYSVRSPAAAIFGEELRTLDAQNLVELTMVYTRSAPHGWPRRIGRIDAADIVVSCWAPDVAPTCYVCGPTAFVESASGLLVGAGHPGELIRTERYGSQ